MVDNNNHWLFRSENWGGFLFCRNTGKYLKLNHSGSNAILKAERKERLSTAEKAFIRYLAERRINPSSNYNSYFSSFTPSTNGPRLLSLPLEILFYVTTACNRNCGFCYLPADRNIETASDSVVNTFLDQVIQFPIPVIALVGGEPLLWKGLPKLIDNLLSNTSSRVSVSTNGLFDISELWPVISGSLDGQIGFNVSFHAIHSTDYSSFRITEHDIIRKKEFLQNLAELNVPFGITTVVHKGNYSQLIDIAAWIVDMFTDTILQDWTLSYMHIIGESEKNSDLWLSLADAYEWKNDVSFNVNILSGGNPSFNLCFNIPYNYVINECCPPSGILETSLAGCSAYYSKIEILPSGNVYPCSYFFYSNHMKMGNIRLSSIYDIWSNISALHSLVQRRDCNNSCIHRNWCLGCPGAMSRGHSSANCTPLEHLSCSY